MRLEPRALALAALLAGACLPAACGPGTPNSGDNAAATAPTPDLPYATAPLPENGFRAKITLPDAPARMRAGEQRVIKVVVRNASDVLWKVRGGGADNKYYIAAADIWLDADGETMITNMDGRYGLPNNLQPGEESEVPLQITAPKSPGQYTLEVDLVQEQVSFFKARGSETAKVKVTVE